MKIFKFPENVEWLDGELYNHHSSFNDISSKVRRTTNFTNESLDIQYWVYDCVSNIPFSERYKLLKNTIYETKQIILTPTQFCDNVTSKLVESLHNEAVSEKYEGIMIRKPESIYEASKRSSNLLKFKDCCQDEYEVIGFNHIC